MRRRTAVRIAILAGTLVKIGAHRALPSLAGAGLVSAAVGEIIGHVFGHQLTLWAALALAGGFLLWIGAEINQSPKPPRAPHTEGD